MSVDTIEQRYFLIHQDNKFETLVKLLRREQPTQAIIFCRTKIGTAKLHRKLQSAFRDDPLESASEIDTIHGDMTQPQRDRVFQLLRTGKIQLLVATDVVGRGIDVSTISHIINFDLPQDCDDYVHRVGRTGRMGREGIAFSFVTKDEGAQLTDIEWRINRQLIRDSFGDEEPPKSSSQRLDDSTESENADSTGALKKPMPAKRKLSPMRRKITRRR